MVADRGATARFDVVLSHNRRDAPVVERIAQRLRDAGLRVWLDAWHVAAGDRWQDRTAEGMAASDACAVFLGPHDVGDWEKEELGVALGRAAKDPDFRVFLVLLPGVQDPFEHGRLSPFLNTRAWVDFRGGWNDDVSFQPLISAIQRLPMGPAQPTLRSGAAPPSRTAPRLSRRSAIWLGTLSAALAIAAGMFTLRDQVFPGQSGNAQATSVPEYQQAVGDICGDVNAAERARYLDSRGLREKLKRAHTTLAQRNAVLDSVRRSLASTANEFTRFQGLGIPATLTARHRATAAAWNRNVARIRGYAQRLDAAATRPELLAAIDVLARMRPALGADSVALGAGLIYLGGGRCRLDPPDVERTMTLPPATHDAAASRPGARPSSQLAGRPGHQNTTPPIRPDTAGSHTETPTQRPPPRSNTETPTQRLPPTGTKPSNVNPSASSQRRSVRRVNTPGVYGSGSNFGRGGGHGLGGATG